jgi:hypothetical protein
LIVEGRIGKPFKASVPSPVDRMGWKESHTVAGTGLNNSLARGD